MDDEKLDSCVRAFFACMRVFLRASVCSCLCACVPMCVRLLTGRRALTGRKKFLLEQVTPQQCST